MAICSVCNKKYGLFHEKKIIEVIDKNSNGIKDYQTVLRLFKEHQSETMCYGDGLWHFLDWCKEKIKNIKNPNI